MTEIKYFEASSTKLCSLIRIRWSTCCQLDEDGWQKKNLKYFQASANAAPFKPHLLSGVHWSGLLWRTCRRWTAYKKQMKSSIFKLRPRPRPHPKALSTKLCSLFRTQWSTCCQSDGDGWQKKNLKYFQVEAIALSTNWWSLVNNMWINFDQAFAFPSSGLYDISN